MVTVQLVVEDPDSEIISLDLGVIIDERVVDISESISPSTEIDGSGKVQATFSLPAGVKNYVHLIAHATDSSGAQSEAALILPQNNDNCDSEGGEFRSTKLGVAVTQMMIRSGLNLLSQLFRQAH